LKTLITLTELAEKLGKKKPQISRWKKNGKLVMEGTKVNYEATVKLLNLSQDTRGGTREKGKTVEVSVNSSVKKFAQKVDDLSSKENSVNKLPENSSSNTPNYYVSRAKKEAALAGRETLKLKQEKGELVSKEDEYKKGFELGMKLKDKFMSIPDRISPILAAETEQHTINKILKDELHEVIIDFIKNGGFLDE